MDAATDPWWESELAGCVFADARLGQRLHKLIDAKAKGSKLKLVAAKPKQATGDLAESLRASLAAMNDKGRKKVA